MINSSVKVGILLLTAITAQLLGEPGAVAARGPGIEPPHVRTLSAVVPVGRSISLEGEIFPKGHYAYFWFQWGTTTRYGNITEPEKDEGAGVFGPEGVSADIHKVEARTTYHFRLVAQNASGRRFGRDKTFRTPDHYPPRRASATE